MSKSKMASDRELLELYTEELFVDEQHLAEDDTDVQQAASSTGHGAAFQACHPRRAQSSTLLFDIADLSEPVSQMLDFDHCKRGKVQEAASECAPVRPGCSLTPPSSVCVDAIYNELAKVSKRKCPPVPSLYSVDGFYTLEDDHEHVLRQITRGNFLPGIEHLSSVEIRAASITYDNECSFAGDKVSATMLPGENFFLAYNHTDVGLSAQYPTTKSLLTLIDEMVDGETLVKDFTDPPNFQQEQSTSNVRLLPGCSFDIPSSQFVGYTALEQIMGFSCNPSYAVCPQFDAAYKVSDTSDEVVELTITHPTDMTDEEADELSMLMPSTLSYFDINTQQSVAYTALNQLLMGLDNDETLPRIHQSYDAFEDDEITSVEGVLELGDWLDSELVYELHALHNSAVDGSLSLAGQNEYDIDIDSDDAQCPPSAVTTKRSVHSLCSYSSLPRRRGNRPHLIINTHLSDIAEVSDAESESLSGSSSGSGSDASIDFADRCGFVRPLETRRSDFLDGEDSDAGF
jgi:hypothetical protein